MFTVCKTDLDNFTKELRKLCGSNGNKEEYLLNCSVK
jgi:hypothetical protein